MACFFLSGLIQFTDDKAQNIIIGIFLTLCLYLKALIHTFCREHYNYRSFLTGARIRNSLMNLIYKKVKTINFQNNLAKDLHDKKNVPDIIYTLTC